MLADQVILLPFQSLNERLRNKILQDASQIHVTVVLETHSENALLKQSRPKKLNSHGPLLTRSDPFPLSLLLNSLCAA